MPVKAKKSKKKAKKAVVARAKPVIYRSAPLARPPKIVTPPQAKELLAKERELLAAKAKLKEERFLLTQQVRQERAARKAEKAAFKESLGMPEGGIIPGRTSYRMRALPKSGKYAEIIETRKSRRRFNTKEQRNKFVDSMAGVTLVSGAVALTAYGAMDYAGLSEAVPTQKYTAISLAGWLGIGSIILAKWVFSSPTVKDGAYAVGLSLVAYEVTRQVGNRFADWSSLSMNWEEAFPMEPTIQTQGPLMWGARRMRKLEAQRGQNLEQESALQRARDEMQQQFQMQRQQDKEAQQEHDRSLIEAIAQMGMQKKEAA